MIEIVFEADRDVGFVGLWLHDQRILIIAINVNLGLVLHPVYRLQLVRVIPDTNVGLFLLAFVEVIILVFILGWCDERIYLAKVLLLPHFVSDLKDLILARRDVLGTWVDSALLCLAIDECLRIFRL